MYSSPWYYRKIPTKLNGECTRARTFRSFACSFPLFISLYFSFENETYGFSVFQFQFMHNIISFAIFSRGLSTDTDSKEDFTSSFILIQ